MKRRKSNRNTIIVLSVFIILGIVLIIFLLKPKITLEGKSKVNVPYNEKYTDKGAKAKYIFTDISDKIKTSGSVNTEKVGEYKIKYEVKAGLFTTTKTRTVNVVDEKNPELTLEGDTKLNACPGKKFKEIGYKAIDEYDGDITDKVEVNEKDDSITYTVKDSSGNTATASRELTRVDKENPVISLNGNSTTYVTLGNKFSDPGFTATDNCDEDITDKVEKSGTVDTSKEGNYEIKYKVSDTAGNNVEVTRKVVISTQIVRRSANMSCGESGVIYLTFDDGPNNSTTTQILDVLKKYNVKATFFVTSANGGSDAQIKREYDEGHKIALHTTTHEYSKLYASIDAYFADLKAIGDRVERITGEKTTLIRFPGGSSNTVSRHYSPNIMSKLVDEVESRGYTYFDWNVDSRDAEGKGSNDIYNYTIGGLSKSRGNVVLMHDIKTTTANAIERVIKTALDNGYKFKPLDSTVKCWHRVNN